MTDRTYLVTEIKAALIGRGVIPVEQQSNCDSFQITCRVAWALREDGARLIRKRPEQNGCTIATGERFSHDSLAFPEGWIDCLGSAGPPANENRPCWNLTGRGDDASLVKPFNLDSDVAPPIVVVVDPPVVVGPPILPTPDALAVAIAGLARDVQTLAGVVRLIGVGLEGRYALIEAELRTLTLALTKGFVGRIGSERFGTEVTLRPVTK